MLCKVSFCRGVRDAFGANKDYLLVFVPIQETQDASSRNRLVCVEDYHHGFRRWIDAREDCFLLCLVYKAVRVAADRRANLGRFPAGKPARAHR